MNLIQIVSPTYKTVQLTHTGATVSKTPVVINGATLLPLNDADANEANAFAYEGQLRGPLATGDTPDVGDAVYWDPAEDEFTVTATDNILVGRALSRVTGEIVVDFDAFNPPATE